MVVPLEVAQPGAVERLIVYSKFDLSLMKNSLYPLVNFYYDGHLKVIKFGLY